MATRLRALLVVLWLGCCSVVADAASVVIVTSERSPAHVEALQALVDDLERAGVARSDMLQLTASEWASAAPLSPRLFITLGAEAAAALAKKELRAPLLCSLLPRSSFERVMLQSARQPSAHFSALYLDQPLARQLDLIALALPAARRIGVVWGPESQTQTAPLRVLLRARGLELVDAGAPRDELLSPALKRVLADADVLLALPDPQVYNSNTIQNILLSSFRSGVPLVAFSPAYVRAGALLALYETPAQVGQQTAIIARGVLQGKPLPALPLYAREFSVAVNEHVARSLGLRLNADALREQLRRREVQP